MEVLEIIKNTYIIIVLQFILVNVLILNKEHYKNQNSLCKYSIVILIIINIMLFLIVLLYYIWQLVTLL